MPFQVTTFAGALYTFLFGLCMGLGWFIAGWLVSKVLK